MQYIIVEHYDGSPFVSGQELSVACMTQKTHWNKILAKNKIFMLKKGNPSSKHETKHVQNPFSYWNWSRTISMGKHVYIWRKNMYQTVIIFIVLG